MSDATPAGDPHEPEDLAVELFIPCEQLESDPTGAARMRRVLGCATTRWFPFNLSFAAFVELWGPPFAQVPIVLSVEDASGRELVSRGPESLEVSPDGIVTAGIVIPSGVRISEPGTYAAVLRRNGDEMARRRFRVDYRWSRNTRTA